MLQIDKSLILRASLGAIHLSVETVILHFKIVRHGCILKYNKLQMSVTFTWEVPVDVARVTLVQSDDLARRNEYFVDWSTLHCPETFA